MYLLQGRKEVVFQLHTGVQPILLYWNGMKRVNVFARNLARRSGSERRRRSGTKAGSQELYSRVRILLIKNSTKKGYKNTFLRPYQ